MYVRSYPRRHLGDDSIFSMIGRVVAMPFESALAPGSQFLTLPTPAPPSPPVPGLPSGIPPLVQGDTGIWASIKNNLTHDLNYWMGDKTGGPLTTNEITQQIQQCQKDVIKASRGLSAAQIAAGMQKCQSNIAAVASLPSLYDPGAPNDTNWKTIALFAGIALGGIFLLSR
jgi:hypothetical protein